MILIAIVLQVIILLILIYLVFGRKQADNTQQLAELKTETELLGRLLKSDIDTIRDEIQNQNKQNREELNKNLQDATQHQMAQAYQTREELGKTLKEAIDSQNKQAIDTRNEISNTLNALKEQINKDAVQNREELRKTLKDAIDSQNKQAIDTRADLNNNLKSLTVQINKDSLQSRTELNNSLDNLSESLARKVAELSDNMIKQSEKLRETISERLEKLQSGNEQKLDQMRKTVDEKLHETLEKRLGESFTQVSKRLEEVHQGLGEMKTLAHGVGDLKRTLEGVKPRGILGELQLENLLSELLAPEQYEVNYRPRPRSNEVVEFAIALPGPEEGGKRVYLPIDAKFPLEEYQRLTDAYAAGDSAAQLSHQKNLVANIKSSARDIRDKYINPPHTTDFALMFLPFESLYAEVLRLPGLFELVQREYNVIICGPTTIAALLNSLQVGFKTLAIQKKSSEVWKVLASVKKEFGTFGTVLDKTKKKIEEAGNELEKASFRTRQIERRLSKVEELPQEKPRELSDERDDTSSEEPPEAD